MSRGHHETKTKEGGAGNLAHAPFASLISPVLRAILLFVPALLFVCFHDCKQLFSCLCCCLSSTHLDE